MDPKTEKPKAPDAKPEAEKKKHGLFWSFFASIIGWIMEPNTEDAKASVAESKSVEKAAEKTDPKAADSKKTLEAPKPAEKDKKSGFFQKIFAHFKKPKAEQSKETDTKKEPPSKPEESAAKPGEPEKKPAGKKKENLFQRLFTHFKKPAMRGCKKIKFTRPELEFARPVLLRDAHRQSIIFFRPSYA